jgi:MoaA/NifB/PqqE/SkfB family radical SAM enzyme
MSDTDRRLIAEELALSTRVPQESVDKVLAFLGLLERPAADTAPGNYRDMLAQSIAQLRLTRACLIQESEGDFVAPFFPSHVQIQTVSGCNAACPMCAMSAPQVRLRERGRMSAPLFNKIVAECSEHQECEEIALYLQNEPLLDAKLAQKVADVKAASGGRLRTRIVTNGSLLSETKIKDLISAGLDAIAVSLNAETPDTYKKVMGGLDFTTTMGNIETLLRCAPKTMLVTLTFMITRDNEHEVSRAIEFWTRRGVYCGAYGMNSMAGMVPDFESIRPRCTSGFPEAKAKECYLPMENAAILSNGDVILCCTDWSRITTYGSLSVSSLREIWHSRELSSLRRAALIGQFPAQPCQSCPGQTRVLDNLMFYGGPSGSNAAT